MPIKPNSNPNKPNFKPDAGFSAYYTRDCTALRDSFGAFTLNAGMVKLLKER